MEDFQPVLEALEHWQRLHPLTCFRYHFLDGGAPDKDAAVP
jgi:hypothetical protein